MLGRSFGSARSTAKDRIPSGHAISEWEWDFYHELREVVAAGDVKGFDAMLARLGPGQAPAFGYVLRPLIEWYTGEPTRGQDLRRMLAHVLARHAGRFVTPVTVDELAGVMGMAVQQNEAPEDLDPVDVYLFMVFLVGFLMPVGEEEQAFRSHNAPYWTDAAVPKQERDG